MTFTLTDSPQSGHTLAADQPVMQNNNKYYQSVLNKDHQLVFGHNQNTTAEGRHRSVGFINLGGPVTFPTDGLDSYLYSQSGNLYFLTATTGPFQLTNAGNSSYVNVAANGTTFLPGGLLFQWGNITGSPITNGQAVTFAFTFPSTVFSITFGPQSNSTNDKTISITTGSVTNSGFTVSCSGTSSFQRLNWMAIGY